MAETKTTQKDLYARIATVMADHPVTNKEMAAEFAVSAQKMSAALRFLVNEGRVIRHEGEKKSDPATFEVADAE